MQSIKKLADEALSLSKKFERFPLAIYQALDNHSIQGSERTRLFGEILKEFKTRRDAKAKTRGTKQQAPSVVMQESAPGTPPLPPGVTAEMMRDAVAHELSQPPSAWDTNHPENSP